MSALEHSCLFIIRLLFLRSINFLAFDHLRLFRRAMFAVHLGQYHLPFGGAVMPTQG